jgi:hypothetical protein
MKYEMKFIQTFESFDSEKLNNANFILNHIKATNPHSGARDAFGGIGRDFFDYEWSTEPVLIQPDDKRIYFEMLYPASKRDVKKYMKLYNKGFEFPPIVLNVLKLADGTYSSFSITDGAHRLQAAINLNVPIHAYIGVKTLI